MRRNRLKIGFLLIALISCCASARAEKSEAYLYEQKIKAGIIYNFLKYTNWPANSLQRTSDTLNVCLFGGDPFDGYLYPLDGKTAQQHTISITQVQNVEETEKCGLVFVHRNAEDSLPRLLEFLKGKPVLTVSDIHQFALQGGMIEMVREDERVSLYVNKDEADAAGIQIAGNILKLAKRVNTKRG